jgi:hypothetical protein
MNARQFLETEVKQIQLLKNVNHMTRASGIKSYFPSYPCPSMNFAAFHHPPWDYVIVFALQPGTPPKHQAEGIDFKAASYPSNWPFGGGFHSVLYAWLDL